MILTKAFLKDLLTQNNLNVKFKKRDGSERTMLCTLRQEALSSAPGKKTDRVKQENDDVVSVWDLEKNAFRSFRIDSIIEYRKETL